MNKRITLYGYGYVGKAVYNFLKDQYDVDIYDPKFYREDGGLIKNPFTEVSDSLCETIGKSKERCYENEYAIVCVPTKMNEDGSCDTSIVEQVIRETNNSLYLIKSTIPPGTTERLAKKYNKQIVFSPEYIGEGKYEVPFWKDIPHPQDMKLHSFHIFGGDSHNTNLWINVWQKVAGWNAQYYITDSTTAEMVKYAENAFLATKKIYCDELYEMCQAFGINYNKVKPLWLLDGRINSSMTLIFPDNRGFKSKCLDKDMNAIIEASKKAGYEPKLLKEVLASNDKFRNQKGRISSTYSPNIEIKYK